MWTRDSLSLLHPPCLSGLFFTLRAVTWPLSSHDSTAAEPQNPHNDSSISPPHSAAVICAFFSSASSLCSNSTLNQQHHWEHFPSIPSILLQMPVQMSPQGTSPMTSMQTCQKKVGPAPLGTCHLVQTNNSEQPTTLLILWPILEPIFFIVLKVQINIFSILVFILGQRWQTTVKRSVLSPFSARNRNRQLRFFLQDFHPCSG